MEEKSGYVMCVISSPPGNAAAIAERLVGDHAAACVQITAPVTSIYRWEGKLCNEGEVLLFLKTKMDRMDLIESIVKELHPYKVPEFIVLPIMHGNPDYLAWIAEAVAK